MSDTKILQAILNGQAAIREVIEKLEKRVDAGFQRVDERFDKMEKRIASLGETLRA
ncbi:MAG: hypothetical protein M1484_03285 [Patescibacteria group bacterium]|nr:hypothetical protein [Patescibacteria group bacterium]MCL5432085.1 hypothetical protein [Patescibacteria group bacterium]